MAGAALEHFLEHLANLALFPVGTIGGGGTAENRAPHRKTNNDWSSDCCRRCDLDKAEQLYGNRDFGEARDNR